MTNCRINIDGKLCEFTLEYGTIALKITERLAHLMYICLNDEQNITCFKKFMEEYPDNSFNIKYLDEFSQTWISYDCDKYLDKINDNYKKIVVKLAKYKKDEFAEIEQNANDKNLFILDYIRIYRSPTCIIKIGNETHNLNIEQDKITDTIAERLAYSMFRCRTDLDTTSIEITHKDETGNWIIYNYRDHVEKINEKYERIKNVYVNYNDEEIQRIEIFAEDKNLNDPVAFYKRCHWCGKDVNHLNGSCGRACDEYVYVFKYPCCWKDTCPICPE